ncbi:MAG: hypothetical protein ABSE90_06780, partial [Verrucomicrobiota bacterium]
LILDGLEPLQYAPTAPTPGELKDQGIAALLKGLAAASHGLCVVTTRYSLPDLNAFKAKTVVEAELKRLPREAGVQLLKAHGVTGSDRRNIPLKDGNDASEKVSEFEKLVEDVDGHALTIHIMGSFLKKAFHGDIRCRDRVTFEKASEKTDKHHAMRAMAAYAKWMEDGSDEARRELAILRLMGLFDRPADAGCIAALLQAPAIPGLTDPLVDLPEEDWNCSLDALETARLITMHTDDSTARQSQIVNRKSLDAHPLLCEYFARQLRAQQPDAWRAAHRRLYEHLCKTTTDKKPNPTLEDLQPLYQAVAHGCQAGMHDEVFRHVYVDRVFRGDAFYSNRRLGAFGEDLGGAACFFEHAWTMLSPALGDSEAVWLLNQTGLTLRALGRLREAIEPMRVAAELASKYENWENAALGTSNLSELELIVGDIASAVIDAKECVVLAGRSQSGFLQEALRTTLADALHQTGNLHDSMTLFREAEALQNTRTSRGLLFALQGFRYCDLLLTEPERAAWGYKIRNSNLSKAHDIEEKMAEGIPALSYLLQKCHEVGLRASQTLTWMRSWDFDILCIADDQLTLGRTMLYQLILGERGLTGDMSVAAFRPIEEHVSAAIVGLREAGQKDYIPRALLTHAWLSYLKGDDASAQKDLDEAWEIAERGPMRLHMADIHLHRARLFFREPEYPWNKNPDGTPRSPKDDLAAAEKLINDCGYHRRDEELADAKRAILGN